MRTRDITELVGTIDGDTGLLLCCVRTVRIRGWHVLLGLHYREPTCPGVYLQRDHSRLKRLANPTLN